jgi:hypothetical protein
METVVALTVNLVCLGSQVGGRDRSERDRSRRRHGGGQRRPLLSHVVEELIFSVLIQCCTLKY